MKYDLDLKPVRRSCPTATQADLLEIALISMVMKVNTHQVWRVTVYVCRDRSGLQKWARRLWRWSYLINWLYCCAVHAAHPRTTSSSCSLSFTSLPVWPQFLREPRPRPPMRALLGSVSWDLIYWPLGSYQTLSIQAPRSGSTQSVGWGDWAYQRG